MRDSCSGEDDERKGSVILTCCYVYTAFFFFFVLLCVEHFDLGWSWKCVLLVLLLKGEI